MNSGTRSEGRLERLETRAELWELVGRYCHLLDARDHEGVAGLFTSAGVVESPGTHAEGRSAISAFYADRLGWFEFTFTTRTPRYSRCLNQAARKRESRPTQNTESTGETSMPASSTPTSTRGKMDTGVSRGGRSRSCTSCPGLLSTASSERVR